jgi:hypothetical protein
MDEFFQALFEWAATKAHDRFGAWGLAAAILILFAFFGALIWWVVQRA